MASEGPAQDAARVLADDAGLSRLTSEHLGSLRAWSTNLFWLVQAYLWGTSESLAFGPAERDFARRTIQQLDDALEQLDGIAAAVTVFRGAGLPPEDGRMPGYVSASLDEGEAERHAGPRYVWRLHLQAGTRALLLPAVDATEFPQQQEVLLGRGGTYILQAMPKAGSEVPQRIDIEHRERA